MKRARRGAGGPADTAMDPLLRRTTRVRVDARPQGECLDAETLAAWTDGSLTAVERAAAEIHAADCDRCLAVLAAIAKTTPPPSAIQRPSWLSFRWLVPLTTAAVAISVWVLVPGAPGVPPAATPVAPEVEAVTPAEPAAQSKADTTAAGRADAPEQKMSRSPSRTGEQARLRQSDTSAKKEREPAANKIAETVQPPVPLAEARPVSPPAPAAAPAPPPPAATRAEARGQRADSLSRLAAAVPGVVLSPDPNVRWRIAGRSVERSTDGGRTWRAQPTGMAVDLLAGASPTANVCWIVGRNGVVLLSTDGETWRPLPSPDTTADLVGVTARDSATATVTAADGRKHTTTDAGRTWTLQEKSPTPF